VYVALHRSVKHCSTSAVSAILVMTAELSYYISMHHCEYIAICETSSIKKDDL